MCFWSVGKLLAYYTAQDPRRQPSSYSSSYISGISQINKLFKSWPQSIFWYFLLFRMKLAVFTLHNIIPQHPMFVRVCVTSSVIREMQNSIATWQTGLMKWSLDPCVHAGRWMFCSQRSGVNGCHIYNLSHSRFHCYHCVTTIEPYLCNRACNNRPVSHICQLSPYF
jgi:hypothetical protein